MNEIFMIFISLSLSGSLVFLLLFLLKPLFKDRLSKTWQYYMLLIVILRLLVPFGPETNLVSMIFNQAERCIYTENVPVVNVSEINYELQPPPLETPPRPEKGANSLDRLRSAGQMAVDLLWLGWLAPAFILMLRKVICYRRSVRSVKAGYVKIDNPHIYCASFSSAGNMPYSSAFIQEKQKQSRKMYPSGSILDVYREVLKAMKIKHAPDLAYNQSIAAPMLAGAVQPVIILPDICLEEKKMRYVLQHELTHYKRWDIIYKWLAQIALCLHWYNPLVYWICQEINRNCELSCDEAVIRRLDENEKYAYGDMLLEAIRLQTGSSSPVASVMLNEDTKLIKERLAAIMKFRKMSKLSTAVSLALAICFLCGAIYTGAYAQTNGSPASASTISKNNYIAVREIPDTIKFDNVPAFTKLQFGLYELDAANAYSLTVSWQDGGDTLKFLLAGVDGFQKEYTLSNGKSAIINVPKDGLYYFYSPRDRETGDMRTLSAEFHTSNALAAAASSNISENAQAIVYESVEMRHYEQTSGSIPAHPYIHDVKTNHTNKKIIEHQCGMLAYDKDGKPLKIDWFPLDSELDNTFYFLYAWGTAEILPGKTYDVFGGWSLNVYGNDPAANEIAYVLYCDKEIVFEDGTVWKNPDFDNWRKTYEGKIIDVKILESYYPYVQKIVD